MIHLAVINYETRAEYLSQYIPTKTILSHFPSNQFDSNDVVIK